MRTGPINPGLAGQSIFEMQGWISILKFARSPRGPAKQELRFAGTSYRGNALAMHFQIIEKGRRDSLRPFSSLSMWSWLIDHILLGDLALEQVVGPDLIGEHNGNK